MPTMLRITARRAGFRRAGIAHPATPVDHPIETFSEEQLAALFAEQHLVVELIDIELAPPPARVPDTQPSDDDRTDGLSVSTEGAGTPAPSAEPISTPDVQQPDRAVPPLGEAQADVAAAIPKSAKAAKPAPKSGKAK